MAFAKANAICSLGADFVRFRPRPTALDSRSLCSCATVAWARSTGWRPRKPRPATSPRYLNALKSLTPNTSDRKGKGAPLGLGPQSLAAWRSRLSTPAQ